jgi:hypothetical protein
MTSPIVRGFTASWGTLLSADACIGHLLLAHPASNADLMESKSRSTPDASRHQRLAALRGRI